MKLYFGYACPSTNDFNIAEVEATWKEDLNEYELCKPMFYTYGDSIRYIGKNKLDVHLDYNNVGHDNQILISVDKDKVEEFVKSRFNKKIEELRKLESKGIQRFKYEGK